MVILHFISPCFVIEMVLKHVKIARMVLRPNYAKLGNYMLLAQTV